MKTERRFVNQILAGESIDQVFLVRDKDLRTSKNGALYIMCTLGDRSGTLPARMWQATEGIYNGIPVDGFIHVKGRCEDYRGALQVIIDACRPWPSDKIDLAEYMPVTQKDVEQMWGELTEIVRDIKDQHLKLLIKKFMEDHELMTTFRRAPAAMTMHHAFVGGLLEHTLSLAKAAKVLLPLYPKVNGDLVLAGIFLHDIGKVAELSAGTSIQYTDRGQLIGHITIAVLWIAEKAKAVAQDLGQPFPQRTLDLLQHIILSHHGEMAFGSPKLPAIPEAFFVHYLDNMDVKIWMTTNQIANDPDPNASFTSFNKTLETRLYKLSGEL